MKKIKYYCDHCGKEMDLLKDYDELYIELNEKEWKTDLCSDCFNRLKDTIENFVFDAAKKNTYNK